MARPLWQQVAPPNFLPAAEALTAANEMTTSGLGNLQKAISGFDTAQTAGANQEVLLRAMGFTDRDALQRAITDRSLFAGYSPSKVTADTLSSIGSRQAALLSRATGEENLAQTQYTNKRTREGNAGTDAFAPLAAASYAAAGGYDPRLGDAVKNLSPQEINTYFSNLQGLTSRDTSNKSGAFNYSTAVRNDQETRAADAVVAALDRAGTDPAISGDLVRAANLNPSVEALVRKRAAVPIDLLGITGGSASGDLFGSMLQTESGGQQFNKDGSVKTSPKGATGIAQIMPATGPEAAKLAGVSWDESRFKNDPQYNAQLGKAYFDKQLETFGGNAEMAMAAYNAGPQATKNAINKASQEGRPGDWLSYLPKETQDYVPNTLARLNQGQGASVAQSLKSIAARTQAEGFNAGNLNTLTQGAVQVGSNPDRILKAAAENISKDEAIKRAVDRGIPAGKVQLDRLMEQARSMGIPYSVAVEVLSNASVPSVLGGLADIFNISSDSRKIDEKKFEEGLINYAAPNGTLVQADTANQLRLAQQGTTQAQQAVQTASQNLMALQAARQRNPAIPESAIQRQEIALVNAQAMLSASVARTQEINKKLADITPVGTSAGKSQSITAERNPTAARIIRESEMNRNRLRDTNLIR